MSSATRATAERRPSYGRGEVFADAAVHGVGAAGSLAAAVVLVQLASAATAWTVGVAAVAYGAALVMMPLVSAAHNLAPARAWRETLRRLDQAAIFVLIAGTYTPFGRVALGGAVGHALLALVWVVAIVGAVIKLWRPRWLDVRRSVGLYLALGWCALPAIGPLVVALHPTALTLLGVGGLLYTIGVIFHLWTTLPFHNAVWHAFVVAAAGCHAFAVFDVLGR